ncbi:major facilitator superfamily transporter [Fusarium sp. NRRL 52700]|nr:major facilitator superfamily transporter [Fusarium sp. NRRL 52700]
MPAQTRVLEGIYCRIYYEDHDYGLQSGDASGGIDERLCKVGIIQSEVAMLKGWQVTLDSIGMLLFSVPWAHVADVRGRKPVLLLLTSALFAKYAFVQLVCFFDGAIPLRWSWLSALHTVFGGSVTVATALIYTIISDVVPENDRTSVFFQVMAAMIVTQFLGPLISAALMVWSPWLPMVLGLGVELISILTLCFIPETLNNGDSGSPEPQSSLSTDYGAGEEPDFWSRLIIRIKISVSFMISDTRILVAAAAFSLHMLFLNRDILLQYISTRYNISLSTATVFISIRSGLLIFLCIFIFPRIGRHYHGKMHSLQADRILSCISAALLALGFLGLSMAPELVALSVFLAVNSLGWGLFPFLRSFLTNLAGKSEVARLNSIIGVSDTLGLMVGSPLLAKLFSKGIEMKGFLFGLPFMFSGLSVLVIVLFLSLVNT